MENRKLSITAALSIIALSACGGRSVATGGDRTGIRGEDTPAVAGSTENSDVTDTPGGELNPPNGETNGTLEPDPDVDPGTDPDVDPEPEGVPPEVCSFSAETVSADELLARMVRLTVLETDETVESLGSAPDSDWKSQAIGTLLADPRASEGFTHFAVDWFGLEGGIDRLGSLEQPLAQSIVNSTNNTIAAWFDSDASMSELYRGDTAVLDEELSGFYDVTGVPGELTKLPNERSAGLLSTAHWLTVNRRAVYRGVQVSTSILCVPIPETPEDAEIEPAEPQPNSTARESLEYATDSPVCAGCHQLINPIGFTFENFDESGNYRTTDNGQPVDPSGYLMQPRVEVGNHLELAAAFDSTHAKHAARCAIKAALNYVTSENQVGLGSQVSHACLEEAAREIGPLSEQTMSDWVRNLASHRIFSEAVQP